MTLTIRTLTPLAEDNLNQLIDKNRAFFKTKTKAIDYVLSNYYRNESYIKELEQKVKDLQANNEHLSQKLKDVKFAVSIFKNL